MKLLSLTPTTLPPLNWNENPLFDRVIYMGEDEFIDGYLQWGTLPERCPIEDVRTTIPSFDAQWESAYTFMNQYTSELQLIIVGAEVAE